MSSEYDEEKTLELIPLEQQTLTFYGKPLVVVRLPDGRPAVVLSFICNNLQIEANGQVRRIRRTEAISDDLVNVRVETDGGPQRMSALILRAVPFWLAGIDPKRVREEIRPDIIRYQREVVDVLYAWAQAPKVAPTALVPSEPLPQPTRPAQDAPLAEWHEYYVRMVALTEWQMDVEQWRGTVESRLEGVEAMTGLIPEILERLGPQTLTPQQQRQVQVFVQQLSKATGKHAATIYNDLYTAFKVPRYQDIPQSDWEQLERWFKVQLERAKKKS
jgi:P22_AR N-terminal domain